MAQHSPLTHKKHLKNHINNSSNSVRTMLLFRIALVSVLISSNIVVGQTIIKTLPGFSGDLPFKFETGYVGVGELDEVQLFYYFAESERNPSEDPLLLWLTGGPGCSGFSGLVYEIGPLSFSYEPYVGVPTLKLNPYSWTKVANIIFMDSPVGTGFSYATTSEAYEVGDKKTAALLYEFLWKWLITHPQFLTNPLYIAGDSYSGLIVPMVTKHVSDGNDAGLDPPMNLKGYMLGNPLTDEDFVKNYRIPFAHRVALISDELYESTKRWCHGVYINVDPSNTLCVDNLKLITQCTEKVYIANVLEPSCVLMSPRPIKLKWDGFIPQENVTSLLLSPPQRSGRPWCRAYNYVFSYNWANDKSVQEALHIREGTKKDWVRCNVSLSAYTKDVTNSIEYHQYLIKKGYRSLVYSGDHDMIIPYLDTLAWIESDDLNLTVSDDWKPWFVEGQVAGFTTLYSYMKYQLTFATLKGAGHTGAEYKPKEGLAMVYRWLAYYSL